MPLKNTTDLKHRFSIKEVARQFEVNESTLRYWETVFKDEISLSRKAPNGARYYTEEEIGNVRLIHHLVKERGMTLDGARRKLKENRETTVNHEAVSARLEKVRRELLLLAGALKDIERAGTKGTGHAPRQKA
ncbi:MAG: MerR family transcriptional regulator [Tannerella sp.]|jgi:DNA-binding transcriptional MerR regulator|nr:MerR family transcriptional regulator [Tannerella sp.]